MKLPLCLIAAAVSLHATTFYLTIAGLGGEPDYEQRFAMLADSVNHSIEAAGGDVKVETLKGATATRANVRAALENISRQAHAKDTLVLLLIGHGSFDGTEYKFNLPGPDITAGDIAALLDRIPAGRMLIVNTTSASGASVDALRKKNRLIVAATKTGAEKNATVFARFWVEAMSDPTADTDKNETLTAAEAFHYAEQKTARFYEDQKRLATEHPMLDDEGKFATIFPLIRLGSSASAGNDPAKKELLARKDDLETQIDQLKYQKQVMPAEEYKSQLTKLLIDLAKLQQELDR